MLHCLPKLCRKAFVFALSLLMFLPDQLLAQCGVYPSMKGQRISNINVAGGYYNGLIQWLPEDYNTNPSATYPVIIYFHGLSAAGNGSQIQLCRILTDQASTNHSTTLPNRIEDGGFANTVPEVNNTPFIVIAPQYSQYAAPYHYASQTEAIIDYVVNNYRVDESRIYLTGMSTGANQVIDYLQSSLARAQRIAAAGFGALCYPTSIASNPNGAENIANGNVATWFTHCSLETDQYCGINTPTGWVNAINAESPSLTPRFTVLNTFIPAGTPYPEGYNYCQTFPHDAWSSLYAPDFAVPDGGPTFYEWLYQYQAGTVLPVVFKSFTARLSNGKVYLRWITTSEKENNAFVVERAGGKQSFQELATIAGSGNSSGERVYEYVDENPLSNLSYYRIKQQDVDGREKIFEVRKVMNKGRFDKLIIITPNPFSSDPAAFINVDRKQRISVFLTDLSGRVLSAVNGTYEAGTTELSLPTSSLPRGMYLVKVQGEDISETHKIIKQ